MNYNDAPEDHWTHLDQPATVERSRLLLEMAIREAKRRTHMKNPSAKALIEVLDDMGFRFQVA